MKITPREKRRHAAGRENFFPLPVTCCLFSRGVIFTPTRVSLAVLSLRKNGGLLVVYAYDGKKDLYSPPPPSPPRSATHAHTNTHTPVTDTQTLKTFFMKTRPPDLLVHEPLNSLVMYAMDNFTFTFV